MVKTVVHLAWKQVLAEEEDRLSIGFVKERGGSFYGRSAGHLKQKQTAVTDQRLQHVRQVILLTLHN